MVKLTTHELKLIAGKIGIKNYQNVSREKLLDTINESDQITFLRIFHKMDLSELQKWKSFIK